jgi:hypothetical protein
VAGLCLLPLSIGTVRASPIVVWLRARVGDKYTILVGQIPIIVGMLFFALRHAALWEAFVTTGLGGLGVGITYACMPAFIIAAVPATHTGSAMALYQVVRSVGLSSGSAVSASILAAYTTAHQDLPRVQGYSVVLFVAAGLCVCVAAVSLLMPATRSRGRMTDREAVEEAVESVEAATLS